MTWLRTTLLEKPCLPFDVVLSGDLWLCRGLESVYAFASNSDTLVWERPLPGDATFGQKRLFEAGSCVVTINDASEAKRRRVLWIDRATGRIEHELKAPLTLSPIGIAVAGPYLFLHGRDARTNAWVLDEIDLENGRALRTHSAPPGMRLCGVSDRLYLDCGIEGLRFLEIGQGYVWTTAVGAPVKGSAFGPAGVYFYTQQGARGSPLDLHWWGGSDGQASELRTDHRGPRLIEPGRTGDEMVAFLGSESPALLDFRAGSVRWTSPLLAGVSVNRVAATPPGVVLLTKVAREPCRAETLNWSDGARLDAVPVTRHDVQFARWFRDRLFLGSYDGVEIFRWED